MGLSDLSRRDFTRLSMSAFAGTTAGVAMIGCEKKPPAPSGGTTGAADGGGADGGTETPNLLMTGEHVCRGLNTCKGKGACKTASNDCKGKNACAGQGKCASAKAHSCHKENDCKGQGGCEESAGINDCSKKGACSVPLGDKTWTKVRAKFTTAMEKAGKKVGPAPVKPADDAATPEGP
jgi:hypothetical protein